MGVRGRVRIRAVGKEVETSALVNTGFESNLPEVILPTPVAERLGLYPEFKPGTRAEEYSVVGGETIVGYMVPASVHVQVVAEGVESSPILASATILHGEEEVIIGDRLAEDLGIVVLAPASGLWRFRWDPSGLKRPSAPKERWSGK